MSQAPKHFCSVCRVGDGPLVPATFLATAADGSKWYECTECAECPDSLPDTVSLVPLDVPEVSPPTSVPPRRCTECLSHGTMRAARFIATDAQGLEWLDCGEHPLTNRSRYVSQTPIEEWLRAHNLLVDRT